MDELTRAERVSQLAHMVELHPECFWAVALRDAITLVGELEARVRELEGSHAGDDGRAVQ